MSINPISAATKAKAVNSATQTQATQSNPYEARDIVAQETMANAAVWMAWAAIFTFAVTLIGTFFLAWQIRLTRKAVEETSLATAQMKRQNEIAEAAQRPWLVYEIEALGPVERHRIGSFSSGYKIVIKNKGPMPATHVNAHIGYTQSKVSFDPNEFINQAQQLVNVVGFSLAPSDEMPWNGGGFLHDLTFNDQRSLPDGSFWVGVAYRGIDGIRDYCTFDVFSFTGNGIWGSDGPTAFFPGHHRIRRVMI